MLGTAVPNYCRHTYTSAICSSHCRWFPRNVRLSLRTWKYISWLNFVIPDAGEMQSKCVAGHGKVMRSINAARTIGNGMVCCSKTVDASHRASTQWPCSIVSWWINIFLITKLRAGLFRVRTPVGASHFVFSTPVLTGPWAHPIPCAMGTGGPSQGAGGYVALPPTPSSAEVK